jgi:hypothetical protein
MSSQPCFPFQNSLLSFNLARSEKRLNLTHFKTVQQKHNNNKIFYLPLLPWLGADKQKASSTKSIPFKAEW